MMRSDYVREKRNVLHRIIDVIKLIGKLGLVYREKENEAVYTLNDLTAKLGDFLELILFLSKYDITTDKHIKECIKKEGIERGEVV